jgi:antitoxin HicB
MCKDYPVYLFPLSKADGGGFVAYVPDLLGCMSDGETQAEALENVQGAISEWIEEAIRLGKDVPAPGTAARRVAQERQDMIDLIKNQLGAIDGKIADLEKRVETIAAAMEERIDACGWMAIPGLLQQQSRPVKPH